MKKASDLPKLVEGLRKFSKAKQGVICTTEESGEHIIAGVSETVIECYKKELAEISRSPLKWSDPHCLYKETVSELSSQLCLSKSPNKH